MISAVVYSSNSGFTKQYAEMLGSELGVPVHNIKDVITAQKDKQVVFLGWVMADKIQGLGKALANFDVKAVVRVAMGVPSDEVEAVAREKNDLDGLPLFMLQGGFDMKKLKIPMRAVMVPITKSIASRIEKKIAAGETLTKEEEMTYKFATEGGSAVSLENLQPVIGWCKAN